jgi:hypothetical protein
METVKEEYPELDKIAGDIVKWVGDAIYYRNQVVKTECPYSAQYILELVISKLEKCV